MTDESQEGIENLMHQLKKIKNSKRKSSKLPEVIRDQMKFANNRYISDKNDEALQILSEVIKQCPNIPKPYQLCARIYGDRFNDLKRREDEIKQANYLELANLCMSSNKDYSRVANLWFKMEQFESAALNFGKALKSDPNNIKYIRNRSICYEKLGRYREAIKELRKGKRIREGLKIDDYSFDKKIAQIYFKNAQFENAKDALDCLGQHHDQESIALMSQILIKRREDVIQFLLDVYQQTDIKELYVKMGEQRHFEPIHYFLLQLLLNMSKEFYVYSAQYLEFLVKQDLADQAEQFWDMLDQFHVYPENQFFEQFIEQVENIKSFRKLKNKLKKRYAAEIIEQVEEQAQHQNTLTVSNEKQLDDYFQSMEDSSDKQVKDEEQFYLKEEEPEFSQVYISDEDPIPNTTNNGQHHYQKSNKLRYKWDKATQRSLDEPDDPQNDRISTLQSIENKVKVLEHRQSKEETNYLFHELNHLMNNPDENHAKLMSLFLKLLEFESNYQELRDKLMNILSSESQKPTFKKAIKSENVLQSLLNYDHPPLLQTKKNKIENFFLKKKKLKAAEQKTVVLLNNVYCVSTLRSGRDFLELLLRISRYLFDRNHSSELFQLSFKVRTHLQLAQRRWLKEMRAPETQAQKEALEIRQEIVLYGLWSTLMENQFKHSFFFIKQMIKFNPENRYFITLLSLIFRKLNNPLLYKTWLSKLTNDVSKKRKEVEKTPFLKSKSMIMTFANSSHNNACFKPALELYDYVQQTDPRNSLVSLMFTMCYLQLATSRLTKQKELMVRKSLYYFDVYRQLRSHEGHNLEIIYNMGRLYAHLNLIPSAISNFESVLDQKFDHECGDDKQIRFKAALNLMQLHTLTGNTEKAMDYLKSHLTF